MDKYVILIRISRAFGHEGNERVVEGIERCEGECRDGWGSDVRMGIQEIFKEKAL